MTAAFHTDYRFSQRRRRMTPKYRKDRVRNARMFMDNYKRTTPCNRCGVVAFMATQAFFVKLPTTTYRRPISALVSGGAAEAPVVPAAEENAVASEEGFPVGEKKNTPT